MPEVIIHVNGMTVDEVVAIARDNARIVISDTAMAAMAQSRTHVDRLAASPEPVYGISTGFGALATRHVAPELRAQLQRSLIRSHAAGVGAPIEREVVRALMTLRQNSRPPCGS